MTRRKERTLTLDKAVVRDPLFQTPSIELDWTTITCLQLFWSQQFMKGGTGQRIRHVLSWIRTC